MNRLSVFILAGVIALASIPPGIGRRASASPPPGANESANGTPHGPETRWAGWTREEWLTNLKKFGPQVPDAEAALPRMIELAAQTEAPPLLRQQVVLMLGRVGPGNPDALAVLQQLLQEPPAGSEIPAAWAAKALARMGPSAAAAAPALERALEAEAADLSVRLGAIDALTQIGGNHPRVVPVLIEWLAHPPQSLPDPERIQLRRAAADGLALMSPAPAPAVPQLVRTLDDTDPLLRSKAVAALASIGFSAAPAADSVAERLVFDEEPAVREQAARALAAMDAAGVERLLHLSDDPEVEVRRLATQGLGMSRTSPDQVRAALRKRLDDSEDTVKLAAAKALQSSMDDRERMVKSLLKLLLSRDRNVRIGAANTLADVKPTDDEIAKSGLLERIEDSPAAKRLWQRFLQQRERN